MAPMHARQSLEDCVRHRGLAQWAQDVDLRFRIRSFLEVAEEFGRRAFGSPERAIDPS